MLDGYRGGAFRLAFSSETLDEVLHVLSIPSIQARHGWTEIELEKYVQALIHNATLYGEVAAAVLPPIRDITDTKFLALAGVSKADYLVTNDRRHLLRLRRYGQTRIITPTEFLRILAR